MGDEGRAVPEGLSYCEVGDFGKEEREEMKPVDKVLEEIMSDLDAWSIDFEGYREEIKESLRKILEAAK